MRRALVVLGLLALSGCVVPDAPTFEPDAPPASTPTPAAPIVGRSPYAGQEAREIKALSEEEIAGYASGAGLGYALPAELNSYPGPLHALQMAEELGLTDAQRAEIQAIRESMLALAVPLGERFLDVEAEIEQRFRDGTMDPETLAALLDESAAIESDIRFAHLDAHLDTKALLTPHQVALYDDMRGYREADHAAHEHSM